MITINNYRVYVQGEYVVVEYKGNIEKNTIPISFSGEEYAKVVAAYLNLKEILAGEEENSGISVEGCLGLLFFIPFIEGISPDNYNKAIQLFLRPIGINSQFIYVSQQAENELQALSKKEREELLRNWAQKS